MGEDYIQQDRSSICKQFQQSLKQSTTSTSFPVSDQQQKDKDSFMNQISNNNKRSK